MTDEAFYAIWLCLLSILVILFVYAGGKRFASSSETAAGPAISRSSLALIGIVTGLLALFVIPLAEWGFSDEDVFILHYLEGKAYPPPIWPSSGRFFPLGHQEWRLFQPLFIDVKLFHLIAIAQYGCFALGVASLLRQLKIVNLLALLFVITLPPVLVSFSNLVNPERTQLMLLPWFLWCLLRWDTTLHYRYALLALISVHVMLYLKEPTVLFVLGLAGMRLAAAALRSSATIRQWHRDSLRPAALDLGLLLSGFLFLALYFWSVPLDVLFSDQAYNGQSLSADNLPGSLRLWLSTEPLLPAALLAGCSYALARFLKSRRFGLPEQLLLAAALYFGSLVLSGLVSTFYGGLPLVVAAVALLTVSWRDFPWQNQRRLKFVLPGLLGLLVALNLTLALPHLLYKQDWVQRNKQLTNEIMRIREDAEAPHVFVEGNSWDAEMLAVYANGYRRQGIVFAIADEKYVKNGEETAKECVREGSCLTYQSDPRPGDLVVDLGQLESERRAILSQNGAERWRYEEERLRKVLSITPGFLDAIFWRAYNFW